MMTVNEFFELFLEELKTKEHLWGYYKFHTDEKSFLFRKAYFCQRLEYVLNHINNKEGKILDIGCGYGTTALFLAMNNIPVHGTTLEFYIDEIESRKKYWSKYGNANLFTISYENLFDAPTPTVTYDYIIIQDTLHHLEPVNEALTIVNKTLNANGALIIIEENGDNIVQNLKLLKQRGFKKTKFIYDEKLQKNILIGDENIRGYAHWKSLLANAQLAIDEKSLQYVRYFYPSTFSKIDYNSALAKEQTIWKESPFKRKYFFFGLNFTAKKIV